MSGSAPPPTILTGAATWIQFSSPGILWQFTEIPTRTRVSRGTWPRGSQDSLAQSPLAIGSSELRSWVPCGASSEEPPQGLQAENSWAASPAFQVPPWVDSWEVPLALPEELPRVPSLRLVAV